MEVLTDKVGTKVSKELIDFKCVRKNQEMRYILLLSMYHIAQLLPIFCFYLISQLPLTFFFCEFPCSHASDHYIEKSTATGRLLGVSSYPNQ